MKRLLIRGGARLEGTVQVSGAKNAALPAMAACLLASEPVTLRNIPALVDVETMADLLGMLGASVERRDHAVTIGCCGLGPREAPYDLVKQMRASVVVLGPLLTRYGMARVSLPGGCAIGGRPVDQHIKGLRAMGAEIDIRHGYIEARADRLTGAVICLDTPTVTGTENLMMAAALARGVTVIENAAREPEVADLGALLAAMGVPIQGAGEGTVTIQGVDRLGGATHHIMPDRIEAATYLAAGMITGGRVTALGCCHDHLDAVLQKMREAGALVEAQAGAVTVTGPERPRPVQIRTMPYPGFPTDMQAQMMAILALATGDSVITETIFEKRFLHAAELIRMGADIAIQGETAVVRGVPRLSGAPVQASDLRAGASLVLAGLVADGETEVHRIYHLERGYEDLPGRLRSLGAAVEEINGE
jgi:UDP-N-acetylglucosamine 1-carboxyvinyltransferase